MSKKKMLEDLSRSGLTATDATKLKTSPLTKARTKKLVDREAESYKIPYFDINGKIIDFFRIRFLEPVKKMGGSKVIRYSQPRDSGVHLYFPPLVNWKTIAEDTNKPIAITEGEKKAAKGCKAGLPTIGLGGVWSFRAKKELKRLIDDFNHITWTKRKVLLIFDSDLKGNPQVAKALNTLAKELTTKGALLTLAYLPESTTGEKQGLDDFLLNNTLSDLLELDNELYEESYMFWDLNEEVCYIEDSGMYYINEVGKQFSRTVLLQGKYAPCKHDVQTADGSLKQVNTFKEWTEWPHRRVHTDLIYAPGEPEVTGDNQLNTWSGLTCEPKRGDIKPWNDLLDFIFQGNKDLKKWFVQWCAYPIQHLGTKLNTSVLLHGLHHGTGKSFVGYILGDIYGKNFSVARQEDIHSSFNGWMNNKQFIMGEEITGNDSRRDADKIKNIITQEKVTVNIKFQPTFDYKDCVNYLFTSNHPDALFLEDKDRRFMVHEVIGEPADDEFYNTINKWRANGGPSHLLYHLMNVDLAGFNPQGKAPETDAKHNMIHLSRSDVDSFVHDLRIDPDSILVHNGLPVDRDLFTTTELVDIYDPDGFKRTTAISMSKALRRSGFTQLKVIKTKSGAKRLWVIRNEDQWMYTSEKKIAEGYDNNVTKNSSSSKVIPINKGKKWKK